MSAAQPSDEVAEDYKASLEYLTTNDRYSINNFTVIAKENTEHADAISNVLVEHIRKVSPLCANCNIRRGKLDAIFGDLLAWTLPYLTCL